MFVDPIEHSNSVAFSMTILSDHWVIGPTDLFKLLDHIFLPDLERDRETTHKLVDCLFKVGYYPLVQIQELFSLTPIEKVTLQSTNLKTLIQYLVDHVPSKSRSNYMGFDQTQRTAG